MGVAAPRTPDDALAALLAYLPKGWAINSAPDGMVANFLRPLAAELSRFEAQAELQLDEVDPRDATYLIEDYERVLGPDPYGRDVSTDSLALRRQIAFQRWTARGGQSPAYFIALAASLGVTITITEKRTSASGRSICGGERSAPTPAQFCWVVGLPQTVVQTARSGASNCGAGYLGLITPNPVQAAILHDAPAHTKPIFSYAG